jgi:hypothetical protein
MPDAQSSMHTHLGGIDLLVVGSSREAGIDYAVMDAIKDFFRSAVDAGRGDDDIAVLLEVATAEDRLGVDARPARAARQANGRGPRLRDGHRWQAARLRRQALGATEPLPALRAPSRVMAPHRGHHRLVRDDAPAQEGQDSRHDEGHKDNVENHHDHQTFLWYLMV